jgi:hypothetical protein
VGETLPLPLADKQMDAEGETLPLPLADKHLEAVLLTVDEEDGGTVKVAGSDGAAVSVARCEGGVTRGVPLGAPLADADCDAVAEGEAGVRMPAVCVIMPSTPAGPPPLYTRHSIALTPPIKPLPWGTEKGCSCACGAAAAASCATLTPFSNRAQLWAHAHSPKTYAEAGSVTHSRVLK